MNSFTLETSQYAYVVGEEILTFTDRDYVRVSVGFLESLCEYDRLMSNLQLELRVQRNFLLMTTGERRFAGRDEAKRRQEKMKIQIHMTRIPSFQFTMGDSVASKRMNTSHDNIQYDYPIMQKTSNEIVQRKIKTGGKFVQDQEENNPGMALEKRLIQNSWKEYFSEIELDEMVDQYQVPKLFQVAEHTTDTPYAATRRPSPVLINKRKESWDTVSSYQSKIREARHHPCKSNNSQALQLLRKQRIEASAETPSPLGNKLRGKKCAGYNEGILLPCWENLSSALIGNRVSVSRDLQHFSRSPIKSQNEFYKDVGYTPIRRPKKSRNSVHRGKSYIVPLQSIPFLPENKAFQRAGKSCMKFRPPLNKSPESHDIMEHFPVFSLHNLFSNQKILAALPK